MLNKLLLMACIPALVVACSKSQDARPAPAKDTKPVAPPATAPPPVAAPPTTEEAPGLKEHILLTPTDVKWGELPPALPPNPDAKAAVVEGDPKVAGQLFAIRVKLPDGYKVPAHFHPADEHVVVLQGTFNMGMGDKLDEKATTALPAGSFAVMPKGHHHFAWAKGETIVQIYGIGAWGLTYVNPDDDPRNQKKAP